MGLIPDKYISEKPMSGWLALSPLFVFLGVYLISSVLANDFYKIPISSAASEKRLSS